MGRKSEEGYVKYQHVEKLGTTEVDGILLGDVYVFPKIDGTNAHVWYDLKEEKHYYGSRNRTLSLASDNAGFAEWASRQDNLKDMVAAVGGAHVYGEWLVPHSLKTYKDSAWRKFYVFDIAERDDETGVVKHYHYNKVQALCEEYGIDYIAPIRIIKNPQYDNIVKVTEENTFLIKDGEGVGEGVVLKNYDFVNKYGRQTWAKVVTSDFKEKHNKTIGAPISKGTAYVEEAIVERYLTDDIIDKVFAKLTLEDGWSSKMIPRLLQTVWYDFINENAWEMIKAHKCPTINYKVLNRFVMNRIKNYKQELF